MKMIAAVSAALVGLSAFAAADECTWDLKAISKARFEKDDPANPEIVKTPFGFVRETAMIFDGKVDVLCTDARVTAVMKAEPEEGLFAMLSPESLIGLKGIRAEWLHNFAGMKVTLPDDKGGAYKVRFRYRANHPCPGYGNARYSAYLNFADSDGKTFFRLNIPDSGDDSDYWFTREKVVEIPAGVKDLHLKLRLDGVGYLKVTGLSLKRAIVEEEPDVSFVVKPYGWIDDRFAIEAGKVGVLDVCWRSRKGFDVQWWKSDVEFVVPKGFEYVGASLKETGRFSRTRLPDGSERIVLPMMDKTQPWAGGFHDNFGIGLQVRATGPVGTEGKLTFRAIRGKEQLGEGGAVTLSAVEPFPVVQPKRYRIGAMMTYNFQNFRGKSAASEAYADYLRDKGVTWIMPQADWMVADPSLLPMWRRKGFDLITPTDHDYLMNAYKLRGTGERPAADRFVGRPGMRESWDFKYSTCPAAVYEERPYFVTNVVPNLAARSAGTDGQWVNWEPFYFRGCYCEACKKSGAEWMKKTGDGNIEHYHSWQHGQLAKAVHRWMLKTFNPSDPHANAVGLMPAIAWCEVGSYGRTHDYPQDKLSKDYIGDFKWIPAWGPYIGWGPSEEGAYNGIGGRLSAYFFAAKDVREELDRNYPDPTKRPKLMGQPAGPNWVIQPEWLEISMDAYFFNRWEAICPWIFPQGADARHWKAFANAVNRAAKYEDAVFDGTRNDAATALAFKPGFEATCAFPDKQFLPEIRNVPLVQQTTYDYKGVRYVAVFNLNENRHAEFTLKTKGLEGFYRVIGEDGQALFGGKTFTGADLAEKGVELSVGVSRCKVFEFVCTSSRELPVLNIPDTVQWGFAVPTNEWTYSRAPGVSALCLDYCEHRVALVYNRGTAPTQVAVSTYGETQVLSVSPGSRGIAAFVRRPLGAASPLLVPTPRDESDIGGKPHRIRLRRLQKEKEEAALRGKTIDLALVGDSITDFWEDPTKGLPWLKKLREEYSVIDLGFGGDGVQTLLWRLEHGELDGYRVRNVALMIGTNNGQQTAADTVDAIRVALGRIRAKQPDAKIILQAILPIGFEPVNCYRVKYGHVNPELAKLANGKDIVFLDFGEKLLDADGFLTKEMAADGTHPEEPGYAIWYAALRPLLSKNSKEDPK